MSDESLAPLLQAVGPLGRNKREESLGDMVAAARVAWASIYDTILIAGGVRDDDLNAFALALERCEEALRSARNAPVRTYRDQLDWYRKLVALYKTRGAESVSREIDDAFENTERLRL